MTRSRCTAIVVGACVLIIGAMAIGASVASAAKWRVKGTPVTSLNPETDAELTFNQGSLLATILGTPFEIRCTLMGLGFFSDLETEGKVSSSTKAEFTGCAVFSGGVKLPECTPHSAGKAAGTIQTLSLKGNLGLYLGEGVVTISPTFGSNFVTVELGEECPFGEKIPIAGTLRAKDTWGIETEAVEHEFQQSFFSSLTALGNAASLDGSVRVYLIFSHAGMKWSGLPE